MRVFLTGASGFIGTRLVPELIAAAIRSRRCRNRTTKHGHSLLPAATSMPAASRISKTCAADAPMPIA